MQILLCAATEMEIAPTIKFLQAHKLPVEVLITGVGIASTLYRLTKKILTDKPQYIIQAGIAGSLDTHLVLGDVVVVQSDTIGDLGVQEKEGFLSVFDMGFADKDKWPWKEGKLINSTNHHRQTGHYVVDAVTVNEVSTNRDRINYYRHQLQAAIETMEGAAVHYVGSLENIPFMQLRALSNYVGERDKTKWDLQGAIRNLNTELVRIFKNYYSI
ncbi:MAG TPA: futalosine hydrolase [Flavisolibacter sp.]|nr:futalosine hydrolase [Flavisolibacter sp.]